MIKYLYFYCIECRCPLSIWDGHKFVGVNKHPQDMITKSDLYPGIEYCSHNGQNVVQEITEESPIWIIGDVA